MDLQPEVPVPAGRALPFGPSRSQGAEEQGGEELSEAHLPKANLARGEGAAERAIS